jgi:hypothetical protein
MVPRTKKLIKRFLETRTTTAYAAKTPEELGHRHSLIFRRLVRRNLLCEIGPGRYYLEEKNLEAYNRKRKTMALVILAISILLLAIGGFFLHL